MAHQLWLTIPNSEQTELHLKAKSQTLAEQINRNNRNKKSSSKQNKNKIKLLCNPNSVQQLFCVDFQLCLGSPHVHPTGISFSRCWFFTRSFTCRFIRIGQLQRLWSCVNVPFACRLAHDEHAQQAHIRVAGTRVGSSWTIKTHGEVLLRLRGIRKKSLFASPW